MVEPGVPPNAGLFFQEKAQDLMAKVVKKKTQRQKGFKEGSIPLTRENYTIIGIGIVVIVLGYLAMLEGSIEGFLPLVVSPILLVLGYCVIIPAGILYRKSTSTSPETERSSAPSPVLKSQG
jgi:hypothetical protein